MADKKNIVILWICIIILCITAISLIFQNIKLKRTIQQVPKISNQELFRIKALMLQNKVKLEYFLKKFPIAMDQKNILFSDNSAFINNANGYIFIFFDMTVCSKCLKNELTVLKENLNVINEKNIRIAAIIGVVDKNEESEIITLKKSNHLFFPCKIIDVKNMYRTLRINKNRFIDTPVFMYTTHEFIVLDVFKSSHLDLKAEELKKWLNTIVSQEV